MAEDPGLSYPCQARPPFLHSNIPNGILERRRRWRRCLGEAQEKGRSTKGKAEEAKSRPAEGQEAETKHFISVRAGPPRERTCPLEEAEKRWAVVNVSTTLQGGLISLSAIPSSVARCYVDGSFLTPEVGMEHRCG